MAGRALGRMAGKLVAAARPESAAARIKGFARTLRDEYEAGRRGEPDAEPAAGAAHARAATERDAHAVAEAMRGVDWAKVRKATGDRTADAAAAMKAMAAEVDWRKVQAGAATVSSALIAAVAAGQIPIGGRLAGPVARAIIDERGLAQQVSTALARRDATPPDFRAVIDTTGRDSV